MGDVIKIAGRTQAQVPDSVAAAPDWVSVEEMRSMPDGWYWAEFPGGWEWYNQERIATRGIDHGDIRWHELMSNRYWGPFIKPPAN